VQVPLYFAGAVAALGVMKIVMGIPLYVAAAYFTYRLLRPVWVAKRGAKPAEDEKSAEPTPDQA
jgi:heme A synthase